MNPTCDRSAVYTKVIGRSAGCPTDAEPVILHKSSGKVPANLCSDHRRAYERAGVTITQQEG